MMDLNGIAEFRTRVVMWKKKPLENEQRNFYE